MFTWYELRTIDLEAAAAFYRDVLGWQTERTADGLRFVEGGRPLGGLVPLPARARERGAPPHWLGHVAVPDVATTAQELVAAGGALRGGPEGRDGPLAVLADPQGVALALSAARAQPSPAVVWHELYTPDPERAWATYSELFGWRSTELLELPAPVGRYRRFAWDDGGRSVGGMAGIAHRPEVHPQWVFYLATGDLERAMERVRALGGTVLGPMELPSGDRVAYCEDGQGASFGLRQPAAAS